jgi:hypothetical protein
MEPSLSIAPTRGIFPAKKVPVFFSSSVRRFVKSSTVRCALATPFTTATTSGVSGTPDESRTDFRASQ